MRKDEHYIADLTRSYTVEAINMLVELMWGGKDERVRWIPAQALLDLCWVKKIEVFTGAENSYFDVLRLVNEIMLSKRNETPTWW